VYAFRRYRHRKIPLVVWHFLTILPLMFLMSIILFAGPGLRPEVVRWLLLANYAAIMLSIGIILAVWMDWLASLFDTRIRGMVMGVAFGISALTGVAGTLVSGRMIALLQEPAAYPVIYLCAGCLATVSILTFLFVHDRPVTLSEGAEPQTAGEMIASFRQSLADRNFVRFLVGRIITAAGFSIGPFITIYYLSNDGGALTPGMVITLSSAQTVGVAIANVGMGRLGDRYGHRHGLIIGAAMQAAALLLLLTTQGPVSCSIVFFCAGICASAGFIPHYNMLFETCPHAARAVHITAGNFVFALGTASIPLLGGLVATHCGLRPLFAASLIISVVALGWCCFRIKDPRVA
jgi:MFS family permease